MIVGIFQFFRIALFSVLFFYAQSSCAQNFEKGLLWQIEAPNGKKSLLFGTMHLVGDEASHVFRKIEKRVHEASVVYTEYSLEEKDAPAIQSLVMKTQLPIRQYLTPEAFEKLQQWMQDHDLSHEDYNTATFFYIYSLLLSPDLLKKEQMDDKIVTYAKQLNKRHQGLEPVQDIFRRVLSFDKTVYLGMVNAFIENLERITSYQKKVTSLYVQEDLIGIHEFLNELQTDPILKHAFVESVVNQRNQNMLDAVAHDLARGGVFMAVGAGHLGGEKGLLKLLDTVGYTLEAVPF